MLFLLAAASCTSDEKMIIPDVYVTFSPVMTTSTRITPRGGTPFSVWAHSLPEKQKWHTATSVPVALLENEPIGYSDGAWQPVPHCYWPSGRQLTVHALLPQSEKNGFGIGCGLTITGFDIYSDPVPYFTGTVADCDRRTNAGCIPLLFTPALSKVDIEAHTTVPSDSVIRIKSIAMGNIAYKGDFTSRRPLIGSAAARQLSCSL